MVPTKVSARLGAIPEAPISHLLPPDLQFDLSGQVREAVRQDRLVPHYQPIVDIRTSEIVGVEALARWMHPSNISIGPDRFIRAAEIGGFIGDLFFQILRRVCTDGVRWDGLKIAVNVSPQQFHDPFLASKILSVLAGTGFPPSRLEIEITEGLPLTDWSRTAETLRQLKAEGVRFALDDFGTGYANLSHLRELSFDCLKIDRSFVGAITTREENRKIIRSIVTLAADFGLTTVAEGIETEEQLHWLRDAGCTYAQGHHFFHPQPASEIDELL
jgi:EAL domain-containing protein (putative c-di-GMP-specific phosphodiesterase class I)